MDIYKIKHPEIDLLLEAMRKRIANNMGVTLSGNRLTMRFNYNGDLVQIETVILNVSSEELDAEEDVFDNGA